MRFSCNKGARSLRSVQAWRARFVAPVVTVLVMSGVAHAQQQTRVAVTGGVATDQRGVSSSAVSVAPTLYFVSTTGTLLSLNGDFTRFDSQAWSAGAGAALAARDRLIGPFNLAFDASGNTSRLSAAGTSASFMTADASPLVELPVGSFTVYGGGRAAIGRISQDESRRLLPGPGGNTTSVSVTRTGVGPLAGATFTSSPAPGEVIRVGVRGERMLVSGESIKDVSVSATMVNSVATFSGTVGDRRSPGEDALFGGATLAININRSATMIAAAGRYPRNRLTGAYAGRYVSFGFAFGSPRQMDSRPPGPTARGVARSNAGDTRFTIEAPDASRVEIAGDFNEWTPIPARRAANGVWYVDLRLKPGQYRYAFRVNGKDWRVPRGATAVDDGFGGKSVWITVS